MPSISTSVCLCPAARVPLSGGVALVALFFLLSAAPACRAQSREPQNHEVVCTRGVGSFAAQFHTGVRVEVGAARRGLLAIRACQAFISWDKQRLPVAPPGSQADVDAFGVDLGLGIPVVALQVKQSDTDCCMAYDIYSLQKPSKLLRTIRGGDFFRAADTDLDGRVEIWTRDAAAFVGFENLKPGSLAPEIALRFENGGLRDVSAEFQPHFDQEIARIRNDLAPGELRDFRDGRPADASPVVTAKVLQIVSDYLYSGREEQAWASLGEMWPAFDVERIKSALLGARARGIRAQVQSVSDGSPAGRPKPPVLPQTILPPSSPIGFNRPTVPLTSPQPILLRLQVPTTGQGQIPQDSNLAVELVLDSVGKVHSAKVQGSDPVYDKLVADSASDWKFIPALKDGQPIAVHFFYGVTLKR